MAGIYENAEVAGLGVFVEKFIDAIENIFSGGLRIEKDVDVSGIEIEIFFENFSEGFDVVDRAAEILDGAGGGLMVVGIAIFLGRAAALREGKRRCID